MDDNTLQAIERLCQLAEFLGNDGTYVAQRVILDTIRETMSRVEVKPRPTSILEDIIS